MTKRGELQFTKRSVEKLTPTLLCLLAKYFCQNLLLPSSIIEITGLGILVSGQIRKVVNPFSVFIII